MYTLLWLKVGMAPQCVCVCVCGAGVIGTFRSRSKHNIYLDLDLNCKYRFRSKLHLDLNLDSIVLWDLTYRICKIKIVHIFYLWCMKTILENTL